MPYKLRISEEEVRAELEKMGFSNISDDAVEVFRRDLLKLIKSDLRKVREERLLEGTKDETSYLSPPTTIGRSTHSQEKKLRPEVSTPISLPRPTASRKLSSKDSRHLKVLSQTSSESDDTTVESGYSDFESESSKPSYSSGQLSDSSTSISLTETSRRPQLSCLKREALPRTHGESRDSEENSHRESQESAFDSHKVTEESSVDSHRGFKDAAALVPKGSACETQEVSVKPKKKAVKRQETLPTYPSRPDPVNLYHFYKAHWDKFKTPGEDPRSKLRWEMRTKLFYSS